MRKTGRQEGCFHLEIICFSIVAAPRKCTKSRFSITAVTHNFARHCGGEDFSATAWSRGCQVRSAWRCRSFLPRRYGPGCLLCFRDRYPLKIRWCFPGLNPEIQIGGAWSPMLFESHGTLLMPCRAAVIRQPKQHRRPSTPNLYFRPWAGGSLVNSIGARQRPSD